MKRILITAAIACLATIVVGRWYAYRQLLDERREEATRRRVVEAALAKSITTDRFAGGEKSLDDVLAALSANSDVPLRIDRVAIRRDKQRRPGSIFIRQGEFTLEELLDRVSEDVRVSWRRHEDGILVTSSNDAEEAHFTQVYPLMEAMSGTKICDDAEELCQLVTYVMEPDSWDEVGGTGVIRPAGGAIVLRHRPDIHRRVRTLIANLGSGSTESSGRIPLGHWSADAEQAILEALERKDSIDFVSEPLGRVVELLAERHGIQIVLATSTLADAAITPETPITKKLANVSLRTILREMLADLMLTYVIRDHVLQITTPEDAESILASWVYDVRDLVEPDAKRGFEDLIDLIRITIDPDSWEVVGGPGVVCSFGDRWLNVTQTPDIGERVELLLENTRAILKPGGVDEVLLNPPEAVSPAVRLALEQTVPLSYHEAPLKAVCEHLTETLGVPLLMRKSDLADAGVTEETPITIDLPPLPLRHAMALLLREMRLALQIGSEVLYVTTAEDAEANLDIRLRDIRHLTSPGTGGIDERTLKGLIHAGIRPDSWQEAGGPGTLSFFRGRLVIQQTDEVQQEVRHLIDVLGKHLLAPPSDATPKSVWIGRSEQEEEILARLQQRDSLQATNPDVEATIRLCDRHTIPVLFHKSFRAVTESEPSTERTLDLKDAPLFEILTELLAERECGFVTGNGVLLLTDAETAESKLRARMYRVGSLRSGNKPLPAIDVARLLKSRIDSEGWDDLGGPGFANMINDDWLLVVQTLPIHRQIEETLQELRQGETLPTPMEP